MSTYADNERKSFNYLRATCSTLDSLIDEAVDLLSQDETDDDRIAFIVETLDAMRDKIKADVTYPFREALISAIADYEEALKEQEENGRENSRGCSCSP